MHRDQFSNQQIPVADRPMILKKALTTIHTAANVRRLLGLITFRRPTSWLATYVVVNIYGDRNKSRARDRYLAVSVDGVWCNICTFVGSQLRNIVLNDPGDTPFPMTVHIRTTACSCRSFDTVYQ